MNLKAATVNKTQLLKLKRKEDEWALIMESDYEKKTRMAEQYRVAHNNRLRQIQDFNL